MKNDNVSSALAARVQQLLEERQRHAEAVSTIDLTLEKVRGALGVLAPAKRGRPRRDASIGMSIAVSAAPEVKHRKRRRRGRFAVSGDDTIMAFIKEHRNPTTQEIKKHWVGEGRGGTADNVLTKMVKAKQLKREPLEGVRGSRYMLA